MNKSILKKICEWHSVTGDTLFVTQALQKLLKEKNIPSSITDFGVLICGNTKNPKVMISAHIDEVGFQIVKQNEDGTYQVRPAGEVTPMMLNNQSVYVYNSHSEKVPGYFYTRKSIGENNTITFSEIYLKTLHNQNIEVGNFGSYQRAFIDTDDQLLATGLDNKIGILLILELIEKNPSILDEVLFAFVTEEETTYACIDGVANLFKPQFAIVVDMTPASASEQIPTVGQGPSVKYAMASYHLHPIIKKILTETKLDHQKAFSELPFLPEPEAVQHNGVTKAINIQIPMLGWHTSAYVMNIEDYHKTLDLVTKLYIAFKQYLSIKQ